MSATPSKKVEFSNTIQTYGSTSSHDSYYPGSVSNTSSSGSSASSSSLYSPSTSSMGYGGGGGIRHLDGGLSPGIAGGMPAGIAPISGGIPTFSTRASPSKEYGNYYGNGYDFYAEGDGDDDDSSEELYLEENFSRYPSPTTLYRSNSVSIVNCEYKLKERFPHYVYLAVFVVLYVALILLGSSLFVLFEANTELRVRDQILMVQRQFLEKNRCVDANDLQHFVRAVLDANDKGVSLALLNELIKKSDEAKVKLKANETLDQNLSSKTDEKDDKDKEEEREKAEEKDKEKAEEDDSYIRSLMRYGSGNHVKNSDKSSTGSQVQIVSRPPNIDVPTALTNWEFVSSLTYVTTLVTTIGYGHVTPITPEGKMLTIIFGVIAIPSTLLFFSIIISTIRDGPVKWIEIMLIKFFARFYHINLLKIRFIHLVLVTLILLSLLIILPAILFFKMEPEWTYLDSFYYCFITITTVGLGDFVPGQGVHNENRTYYLLGTVAYMYIGLCMIMLWIALVLRIPHFNFKTFLVIEEPEIEEKKMLHNERTSLLHPA